MNKGEKTLCSCGHEAICDGLRTGYATKADGSTLCYACCAIEGAKKLRETGKLVGYYVAKHRIYDGLGIIRYGQGRDAMEDGTFGDWSGTLSIPVKGTNARRSINNFGAERIDFWFTWEGSCYRGVNIGDNQIARVRRIKLRRLDRI